MGKKELIEDYIDLAKKLGSKIEDVQGGGGNISIKVSSTDMYIKASGSLLKDIDKKNIGAHINYEKIKKKLQLHLKNKSTGAIEKKIDSHIQENTHTLDKKASIETSMHILLPGKIVFHNHSIYINIFSCSKNGEKHFEQLFGEKINFIRYASPGAGLSRRIYKKHGLASPQTLILENHGIIIHSDNKEEIITTYLSTKKKIKDFLKKKGIKLFENGLIQGGKGITWGTLSPHNMLKKFIIKNKLSKHMYPDSIVFGEDILFDGVKNYIQGDKIVINTGNTKKDISILENLVAINYILYVHDTLGFKSKFLGAKEIKYILNMDQEKYRKSLYVIEKKL
ncbi:MAG: class II aldolase/adducin family protein [candidate division SR1 bacterium]|nr:class II aldolase/adducin family protein [candidate division SR1 bacterium]